jgi:hypothetical protein
MHHDVDIIQQLFRMELALDCLPLLSSIRILDSHPRKGEDRAERGGQLNSVTTLRALRSEDEDTLHNQRRRRRGHGPRPADVNPGDRDFAQSQLLFTTPSAAGGGGAAAAAEQRQPRCTRALAVPPTRRRPSVHRALSHRSVCFSPLYSQQHRRPHSPPPSPSFSVGLVPSHTQQI